jgi:hypothetical protein
VGVKKDGEIMCLTSGSALMKKPEMETQNLLYRGVRGHKQKQQMKDKVIESQWTS